jgi:hypothetical protein
MRIIIKIFSAGRFVTGRFFYRKIRPRKVSTGRFVPGRFTPEDLSWKIYTGRSVRESP